MSACFVSVASEAVRLASMDAGVLNVVLSVVEDGAYRERAAARYALSVSVSLPGPWGAGVVLVDSRGYVIEWTFEEVGQWLVKSLGGVACVVNLTIPNAEKVPAVWTVKRLDALRNKVMGMSVDEVLGHADKKEISVLAWVQGARRDAVLGAAKSMREAAALLLQVQSMQAGLVWSGDMFLNSGSVSSISSGVSSDLWAVVNLIKGETVAIDSDGATARIVPDYTGPHFVAVVNDQWSVGTFSLSGV